MMCSISAFYAAGLGLIGGADGPTAVFVSGNPAPLVLLFMLLAVSVGIVSWLLFQRKK